MVKLSQQKTILVSGIVVAILLSILLMPVRISVAENFQTPATRTVPSTALIEGVEIVQEFPAGGAPIEVIAIQFATYQRSNAGSVQLSVRVMRGDQWQTLATKTIAKELLKDNVFQPFMFSPPIQVRPNERLVITITADKDISQAISWWIDPDLRRDNYQLLVNGAAQPGMGVFKITYAQEKGTLFTLIPTLWKRVTIFLDPIWQITLIVGLLLIVLAPILLLKGLAQRAKHF